MTLLADLTWPRRPAWPPRRAAGRAGRLHRAARTAPALATDTDIAVALAVRLAAGGRRTGRPPVSYGSSGEHAGFAGTLSIGQAAVELVLTELGRSAAQTFGHLLSCARTAGTPPRAAGGRPASR